MLIETGAKNAKVSATARLTVTALANGRLRYTGMETLLAERPIASVSRPNEMIGGTLFVTVIVAVFDVIEALVAVTVVAPIATPVTTPDAFTDATATSADANVNVPPEMK